jgi:hypothetical protein
MGVGLGRSGQEHEAREVLHLVGREPLEVATAAIAIAVDPDVDGRAVGRCRPNEEDPTRRDGSPVRSQKQRPSERGGRRHRQGAVTDNDQVGVPEAVVEGVGRRHLVTAAAARPADTRGARCLDRDRRPAGSVQMATRGLLLGDEAKPTRRDRAGGDSPLRKVRARSCNRTAAASRLPSCRAPRRGVPRVWSRGPASACGVAGGQARTPPDGRLDGESRGLGCEV